MMQTKIKIIVRLRRRLGCSTAAAVPRLVARPAVRASAPATSGTAPASVPRCSVRYNNYKYTKKQPPVWAVFISLQIRIMQTAIQQRTNQIPMIQHGNACNRIFLCHWPPPNMTVSTPGI